MLQLLLTAIISLFVISSTFAQKSFEGRITYDMSREILSDTIDAETKEWLLGMIGTSTTHSYGKKMMRLDYTLTGDYGINYAFIDLKNGIYSYKTKRIDTLYQYDLRINSLVLDGPINREEITFNGLKAFKLSLSGRDTILNTDIEIERTYLYDSLYYNPKKFKRYIDYYVYEFALESKALYVQSTVNYGLVRDTYILRSVEEVKIENPGFFDIPKNLPIKKRY